MKHPLFNAKYRLIGTFIAAGMILLVGMTAGCISTVQEVDEARSLMAKGDVRLASVDWNMDPPGIIEAKLAAAEVDFQNAYASVAGITPGKEDEPDEAYALRELIKSRITLVSAALEIQSALEHIMDAQDNARLYQYDLWNRDMACAREDLRSAHGYLDGAALSLDDITLARVPVAMQGDIAAAKITCANLDERAGRLEAAIDTALI